MNKLSKWLLPVVGAGALLITAALPAAVHASWLSQAVHAATDQDQPVTYYDPVVPYYYPSVPAPVTVPAVPGYTYYESPGYVPYAYHPHWHGYWDRDHHWHEHHGHFEHHR